MIGFDHRAAAADVRGQVRFTVQQLPDALRVLASGPAIDEAIIISTCNRTEVYFATADWRAATAQVRHMFATVFLHSADAIALDQGHLRHEPFPEALALALRTYSDQEVAQHLFRVACGLQSLVVGETQILGQVKEALATAEAAQTAGDELRALFTYAIKAGKRVHDLTGIGRANRSVAAMAVDVAQELLGNMARVPTLIIGAGRTSQLCTQFLHAAGVRQMILANRSPHAAIQLARVVGGTPITLDDLARAIPNVMLIISATAAPHTVLSTATVAQALKGRQKPLFILDLAIPCDVEPEIGHLPGVSLYTLDRLYDLTSGDAAEWTAQRSAELAQAEEVVAGEIASFARNRMLRSAGPCITALRQYVDRTEEEECSRALAQLEHLSVAERAIVERLGHRLTGKLFHHFVSHIRSLVEDDTVPPDVALRVLSRLFSDPVCAERPAAESSRAA
jgi:glutamyl-tRNA reductase